MIVHGLRTLLLAQTSVTNIVGSDGVYGGWVSQSKGPPYAKISRIEDDPLGDLQQTSGKRRAEIDITCYGKTEPQAANLADTIANFIKDYTGSAGSETIDSVSWFDETDEEVPPQSGEGLPTFISEINLIVIYTPA